MKIIFYCQYVWGMGHLFRSIELVRALSEHDVILIAGGQEVDVGLPENVTLVRLPVLYMDEQFTTLIAGEPERNVEDLQRERKEILFSLFEEHKPELFIIELYPFGRTIFGFELKPLLESIRQGKFGEVKIACSLRDILVEKKDPQAYEERVIHDLNTFFDLLLIHSDPELIPLDGTFSRLNDIQIPIRYTGFVTRHVEPKAGTKLRQELGIDSEEQLIVVSAGGGRSGFDLLNTVLDAYRLLPNADKIRLEMFSGPFREPEEHKKLAAKATEGIRVRRFTKRFLEYLSAADLSVSLAGYNTCMNLLVTGIPALVFPYPQQQEQPIRVEKIKPFLPMKILEDKDIAPPSLCHQIRQMLLEPKRSDLLAINLNGAENAARYLNQLIDGMR
jgi:predicted glycosyltransferase